MKNSFGVALALLLVVGCASKPYDYTNFRKYSPRSILVLPPLNSSGDVTGSYSCLATVTRPIAEKGFYVFPVEVIDRMLKENGLPTPGEMHQASLKKISEILAPDAVLYLNVTGYGTRFSVITSNTRVTIVGRLVHAKTGTLLWEGRATANESSSAQQSDGVLGMIVNAAVAQAVNSATDRAHDICRYVSHQLFLTPDHGLLDGPYAIPKNP